MKKVIICVLLLCMSLVACVPNHHDDTPDTTTTPTSQPSTQHTSTTSSTPTIQPPPVPTQPPSASTTYPGIREPVTTTRSPYIEVTDMNTYNSYLQAGRFPNGFVTLEQLPEIGEMMLVKTYTREHFTNFFTGNYKFLVNKEYNYELKLAVFRDRETYLKGVDFTGQYSGDLRKITMRNGDAHICIGGFTYLYTNGVLTGVNWVYNGYLFDLFFMQGRILPLTDETASFIRDLLHTDTAERAMQTFKASMESAAVK